MLDAPWREQRAAMVGEADQHAIFADDRGDTRRVAPTILEAEYGGVLGDHRRGGADGCLGVIALHEIDDEIDRTDAGRVGAGRHADHRLGPVLLLDG